MAERNDRKTNLLKAAQMLRDYAFDIHPDDRWLPRALAGRLARVASGGPACLCLDAPLPHGPVGASRVTNPACPVHGAGAPVEPKPDGGVSETSETFRQTSVFALETQDGRLTSLWASEGDADQARRLANSPSDYRVTPWTVIGSGVPAAAGEREPTEEANG